MKKNLYAVLGISPETPHEDVKPAYHARAREHHPDAGGDRERFEALKAAYEVLSDPDKRRAYEAARHTWLDEIGAVQCPRCGEANRIRETGKRPVCGVKSCRAELPVPPPNPLRERAVEALSDIGERMRVHVAELVVEGIDLGFEKLRGKLGMRSARRR